jgi:small subunit ribosomal protein S13
MTRYNIQTPIRGVGATAEPLNVQFRTFTKMIVYKPRFIFILTQVFGIGRTTCERLLQYMGFHPYVRCIYLNKYKISRFLEWIEKHTLRIEENLRQNIENNIAFFIDINSYKGNRHSLGLPVRGQRTHTNRKSFRRIYKFYLPGFSDKQQKSDKKNKPKSRS